MFREEYVAPGTVFKELVAEDPAGFKNSMRMDSEKSNWLKPNQLFSRLSASLNAGIFAFSVRHKTEITSLHPWKD